jgi:AcrR family transcriptional regulator
MAERGPAATSLDDVRVATRVSKSQLYHYFGDKRGLVEAVVEYQAAYVLGHHTEVLASVRSWEELERWADGMVAGVKAQGSRGGCPVGTMAAALADTDERLRLLLHEAFQTWQGAIGDALRRLRANGLLAPGADIDRMTTTTLAAIQGGLLLAKTSRDSGQLRIALDGAITQLRGAG